MDALSALVALACRARRDAVRVGAVRCLYELLLRNPLNVACFVAGGQHDSDVGGFGDPTDADASGVGGVGG
eukprot:scaffold59171_cov17-Phaeocystis_antarctica.AAC.1